MPTTSESFEFIKWLIAYHSDVFLLFIGIFIGIILITFDYIKSIKSVAAEVQFKDLGSRRLSQLGLLLILGSIVFFVLSYAGQNYYPQYLTVNGEIKYWDERPARYAYIKIGGMEPVKSNDFGIFTKTNVPRNADNLSYNIGDLGYIQVPFYIPCMDLLTHDIDIKINKPEYIITGTIYNENNMPLDRAEVSIGNRNDTTSYGLYSIMDVCYDPRLAEKYKINVTYRGKLRYSMNLRVSSKEFAQEELSRNITLSHPLTTTVFGQVHYNDRPVANALVEIDGKNDSTDVNGNYSIRGVSRTEKSFKVIYNGISKEIEFPLDGESSILSVPPFLYTSTYPNPIYLQ
jgi:hypothetical protein